MRQESKKIKVIHSFQINSKETSQGIGEWPWVVRIDSSGWCYTRQTRHRDEPQGKEIAKRSNSCIPKTSTYEIKNNPYP